MWNFRGLHAPSGLRGQATFGSPKVCRLIVDGEFETRHRRVIWTDGKKLGVSLNNPHRASFASRLRSAIIEGNLGTHVTTRAAQHHSRPLQLRVFQATCMFACVCRCSTHTYCVAYYAQLGVALRQHGPWPFGTAGKLHRDRLHQKLTWLGTFYCSVASGSPTGAIFRSDRMIAIN